VATSDSTGVHPAIATPTNGPYVEFGPQLIVEDGCNGMTADYMVDATGFLTLGLATHTLIGCPPTAITEQASRIGSAVVTGAQIQMIGNTHTISYTPTSITLAPA
jgi:hypothetical protein